jgi:phosphatidylglycerophosphate synthase
MTTATSTMHAPASPAPDPGPGPQPAVPVAMSLPGKPLEAEEWIDERVHRPLAHGLVTLLVHTPITPNQVTLVSALLGVSACVALVQGIDAPRWRLVAGLLLFLSVIADCADGQLARAKRIHSTHGAALDGISDYVVGGALTVGGSWFMVKAEGSAWFILLGVVGLASIAAQVALFDHTKSRYIARLRTGYAEREEDLDKLEQDRAIAWRERRLRDALLLWIYLQYTRAQQASHAIPAAADPAAFRAANRGRMQTWTLLGSGTMFCLAYAALVAAYFWPPAVAAFFAVRTTVFNLLLVTMRTLGMRGDSL